MNFFLFIVPIALTVALISLLSFREINYGRTIYLQSSSRCTEPPAYRIGYQRDETGIIPLDQGFRFQGASWLEADLCTPGVLTLTGDGEIADGESPLLSITLNGEPLTEIAFTNSEKIFDIPIPKAGRLQVAYLNDYYLADVRVATLERFQFNSRICQTLIIDVPKQTGGQWQPEYNSANLVSSVAMTVIPCAAGELTLQIVGRSGRNVFPILNFEQSGKTLLNLRTTEKRQRVSISLNTDPLKISLTNPYGKTLADRNLNLRQIKFTPTFP